MPHSTECAQTGRRCECEFLDQNILCPKIPFQFVPDDLGALPLLTRAWHTKSDVPTDAADQIQGISRIVPR